MPISGLTEIKRLPRVGKIHLGIKKKKVYPNGKEVEYPSATPFFVVPPEVEKVYGKEPKKLDVIIPVEDDELWCSQYYRMYSNVRGLVCKGDGQTCRRMIDTDTGAVANRATKTVKWEEGLPCQGRDCPDYQSKSCQEVMNLQVLLPKVAGLGIWQIDTGSINSIRNINNCAAMIRAICDRVSWVPLTLTLEPTEVVNPDDGKKKTVYCMHLKHEAGFYELIESAARPKRDYFITMPADDEAPRDKLLTAGNSDNKEEFDAVVEEDIDTLFGAEPAPATPPQTQPNAPSKNSDSLFSGPVEPTVVRVVHDWAWVKETLPMVGRTEKDVIAFFRKKGMKFNGEEAQSVFNTADLGSKNDLITKLVELREAAGK